MGLLLTMRLKRIQLMYKNQCIGTGTIRDFDPQFLVVQVRDIVPGVTGNVDDADNRGATIRFEILENVSRS